MLVSKVERERKGTEKPLCGFLRSAKQKERKKSAAEGSN